MQIEQIIALSVVGAIVAAATIYYALFVWRKQTRK